ncbi:MAG: hypothetical protein KDB61_15560, partial [Planctomycetes bacterium]|nr:hypothetical protein [Planctomycetota bacterium]
MNVIEFPDAASFLERTRSFLESDQALYGLALGTAQRVAEGHRFGTEDPWFAVVEEGEWLRGVVLHTPPKPMMIVSLELEAITPLIQAMRDKGRTVSDVTGPADSVPFFTGRWAHIHGLDQRVKMHLRMFCLDRVVPPDSVPAGAAELAQESDLDWLDAWTTGFVTDCHLPPTDPGLPSPAVDMVQRQRLFLWKDAGVPKCMAAFTRETPDSFSISWVYTPKEFRGHGYASALVAAISQQALDRGKRFVS